MPGDVLVEQDAMMQFLFRWFGARTHQEHLRRCGVEQPPLPAEELEELLLGAMETMRGPDGRRIHFIQL